MLFVIAGIQKQMTISLIFFALNKVIKDEEAHRVNIALLYCTNNRLGTTHAETYVQCA